MTLSPGTRLGAYEITGPIGEGGMGQVYRATDTKLKRQVAIKILTPSLAPDADRLARFQREAEVLASLNHPHIAAIYGVEETDSPPGSGQAGVKALVMEFVSGEDLSGLIARGAVPLDETLAIARQITEALEAAHEQGIIHRDLKPANIKVRDDGTVKVLDFGLAKMLEPAGLSPSISHSPTITTPGVTGRGVMLGTASYMSPEQARGKLADKRSDVWAFGCVLYEMLTGKKAFDGEEITDVLAAIVRDEPQWERLPAGTPAGIRRLLHRTLKKDRKQRLADMADVRIELSDASGEAIADVVAPKAAPRVWRERAWAVVAVAAVAAAAAAGIRAVRAPQPGAPVVLFEIPPPPAGHIEWGQPVSPDGRTIAFISSSEGKKAVWVRRVDSSPPRLLPGSEGATRNFWSPDSLHVAYFVDGDLKASAIDGSAPRLIARGPFRDGAWSGDGVILLGGQLGQPLMRVSALGGTPVPETRLDESLTEVSHDYPEFLPDGRHYLFVARLGVRTDDFAAYVGTLGSSERRPLPGIRTSVKYSPSGHLLFIRGTTLMAQPFSLDRLELSGEPFPVAEQVGGSRTCTFSVSENGNLAYIGGPFDAELVWFDRSGRRVAVAGPAALYGNPSLAPNGRAVAFDRGTPPDVWLLDLDRQGTSKITSDRAADRMPVWSPTGQALAFTSNRNGTEGVYEHSFIGASEDRLILKSDVPVLLSDWSRDGNYIAYSANGDVWAFPLAGARQPLQVTTSRFFQEFNARFSPDGRWIAYQSDESKGVTRSGEGDVFVQSFPERSFTRQVSTGGGFSPRWSDDGKELFYVAPDGVLMAVAVAPRGTTLDVGAPRALFTPRLASVSIAQPQYNVAKDGRFFGRVSVSELSVTVIVNWFEHLKQARTTN